MHSTPLLCRNSERGRDLPEVTQQSHDSARIRTLNPNLDISNNEVSRFECLDNLAKKGKHVTSTGNIRGPQREHAQIHSCTHSHSKAPQSVCMYAPLHLSWRLNCFCFLFLGEPGDFCCLPRSSAPTYLPPAPLNLVPPGPWTCLQPHRDAGLVGSSVGSTYNPGSGPSLFDGW